MTPRVIPRWVSLLAVASTAEATEGEWSRFRGPNGSGLSEAVTVPAKWTARDYNWTVKLPGIGHSSPVVWGERIFVTSAEPATAKRFVLCLHGADGRVLWQREYASQTYAQHRDNCYATATPAVDAAGVVVTWTTPKEVVLLALDLDGRELWRRDLGPFVAQSGSGISPILYEDLVVLANEQDDLKLDPNEQSTEAGNSFLIAVDRKTGQTRWQLERSTTFAGFGTPCVHEGADGRRELIFTSRARGVTGVDPQTGRINWELNQELRDRTISSPVVASGLVFAGSGVSVVGKRLRAFGREQSVVQTCLHCHMYDQPKVGIFSLNSTSCYMPHTMQGIVIPMGSGPIRTLSRAQRTAQWKARQEDYLRLVEYARGGLTVQ